jgi:hypothetical protein
MAHFIDLFSPETYETFGRSTRTVSGFRLRHKGMADRIKPGDTFVCYLTRLSRWCGMLEVIDGPFIDNKPIFLSESDPFVVRFHVRPVVWLDIDESMPIHDDIIWDGLSFTQKLEKGSTSWTGKVRGSLVRLEERDGEFLIKQLKDQAAKPRAFPIHEQDAKKLSTHTVNRPGKVVTVSVPEESGGGGDISPSPAEETESRESIQVQALLAQVGVRMGMSIWIPRADRGGVQREWKKENQLMIDLMDRLPLNYDDTTLRTIEQIDVLWLRGRSIVRAFEVEHTTSVYSGILRMADLLALQPNMEINLHIVAPAARREKVFQEIRRPVFSLLEKGPLAESCTYLSYDGVRELAALQHLSHLSDSVLDEYSEEAE